MTIQSGEESNYITDPRLWGLSTEEAGFYNIHLQNMHIVGNGVLTKLAVTHVVHCNYASALSILGCVMESDNPKDQLEAASIVAEIFMFRGGFCDRRVDLPYERFSQAKSVVCALAENGNSDALKMVPYFNRLDR